MSSNVTSIVAALERRAWERSRKDALSRRRRSIDTMVEAAEFARELEEMDLDNLLSQLAAQGDAAAHASAGELRCARGLRSCLRGEVEAGMAEWAEVMAEYPDLPLPYVVRARWHMKQDPAAALIDLDRAVALGPSDANVYWRRGDCHLALGDSDRAMANYRRALGMDPRSIDGLHALAALLVQRGEYVEALGLYNRLIPLAPGYVDFYEARAETLERTGSFEAALADYDKAIELTPKNDGLRFCRALCASLGGHLEEAIAALAELTALHPDNGPYFRTLGAKYVEAEQHALALPALSRAVELTPEDAYAHSYRGRARMALGDAQGGIADFERACTLDPSSITFAVEHLNASTATLSVADFAGALDRVFARFPEDETVAALWVTFFAARRDFERPIADWDRAITLAPRPEGYVARAVGHAKLGHAQPAFDDVSRAIELAPDLSWAYTARAIYRTHLDHEEHLILADFDRAIELEPDALFARYQRGVYRQECGDFEAAALDFDRAIGSAPKMAELYFRRASCRIRVDDADLPASVADMYKALELGCLDDDLFVDLSVTQQTQGDLVAAIATLDRGIEAVPTAAQLFYWRHVFRKRHGDEEGAAADRARAVELGFKLGDD